MVMFLVLLRPLSSGSELESWLYGIRDPVCMKQILRAEEKRGWYQDELSRCGKDRWAREQLRLEGKPR